MAAHPDRHIAIVPEGLPKRNLYYTLRFYRDKGSIVDRMALDSTMCIAAGKLCEGLRGQPTWYHTQVFPGR